MKTMSEGNGDLRKRLYSLRSRRYMTEDIPLLGECMFQSITERERSLWEQRSQTKDGKRSPRKEREVRQSFVALTWVDPETKARVLTDAEVGSRDLEEVDSVVLSKMCDVAFRHCGIIEEVTVEDEVKNLDDTPADSPPSD